MSEADKDGRIAQAVSEMHAVLGMEINESLIESRVEFDRIFAEATAELPRKSWLARLFCRHSVTETVAARIGPRTERVRHCLKCGKGLRPSPPSP